MEWFAIRVRSRSEKLAAAHVRAKGIEVFPSTAFFRRCWADRVRVVEMPLFPGYIFARFDSAQARMVESAAGVASIVKSGNRYCAVDAVEMEAIRKLVGSRAIVQRTTYQPGTRVLVKYGPFAGAEGILTQIRNQHRLAVSISILRRSIAVDIDEAMVEPLGSRRGARHGQEVANCRAA
jgi:transcription antitermination factor NusG